MTVYLTGIQPSGAIHIGNYFGAIESYARLPYQNTDTRFLMIADMHSLTSSTFIHQNTSLEIVAMYLAATKEYNKTHIFTQSSVNDIHAELTWILSCITPLGWLERMTQFKDKSNRKNDINLGLLSYPVLMACDILLYNVNYIPVGEDQIQHIEFVRDLAIRANHIFQKEIFSHPTAILPDKKVLRIMSLDNGKIKMSKSNQDKSSCIYINDSDDIIKSKIMSAKTDSYPYLEYDKEKRPEIANLLNIFSYLTDKSISDIIAQYGHGNTMLFKKDLADALIDRISVIRSSAKEIQNDKNTILDILNIGSEMARDTASRVLREVKIAIGLI